MSIFLKKHQLVFLLMLIMLLFTLFQPNFAFAQSGQAGNLDNSPISRGLCNVFELVGGNIGKALAIFAIVMVGFGFFSGKFSIALVIGITLGIGILFGAPKIIAALTGEQTVNCKNVTPGDDIVCPGALSFINGGAVSLPTQSTTKFSYSIVNLGSASKSYISAAIGGKTLFSLRCVADAAGSGKWQFDDIIKPFATSSSDSPFSGIISSSFPVTNGIQPTSQPTSDTQITLDYNKICPIINKASLSIAASGAPCTSSDTQLGVATSSLKICVNIGDNSLFLIGTSFTSQISAESTAVSETGKSLSITIPGVLGQTARATVNGVNLIATCTIGSVNKPAYWNIAAASAAGSFISGSMLQDITFD
jgi:type IV secretion system protein VirB2